MKIVVTGATGNIGKELVRLLTESGEEVTVIARNPDKLSPDVRARVKSAAGDLHDRSFLVSATAGADALLWLTPPSFTASDVMAYYRTLGETAAEVIRSNRIGRVVMISSVGAQDPDAGAISGVGLQEKILGDAAQNLLILRNGFFMENFLMQAESLRRDGAMYSATNGDTPIPMVATRDIASVAAAKLRDNTWAGHAILGVQGPEDLSYHQAAQILSEVLGKEIRYMQVSEEQVAAAMVGLGASPQSAAGLARLQASLDHPGFQAEPRTPETTTPTTLKQWATEVLKPALSG